MIIEVDGGRWTSAVADLRGWARTNRLRLVVVCGLWGMVCWLLNVLLIVGYYDGWRKVPFGGTAIGEGNMLLGSLFWGLASSLLFSLAARRARAEGSRRVAPGRANGLGPPRSTTGAPTPDAYFMWGIAAGALLFRFFGAAIPLYAAVLMTARLSTVSYWITLLTFRGSLRLAAATAGRFPGRFARWSEVTVNPLLRLGRICGGVLAGCLVNFAVGLLVPSEDVSGVFAPSDILLLAAVVLCVRLAKGQPKSLGGAGDGTHLLMTAGMLAAWACLPSAVFADDGGWREGGSSLAGLLDGSGFAYSLLSGGLGGLAAGVGAAVGEAVEHLFADRPLDIEEAMREEMRRARARRGAEELVEREMHRPQFKPGERRPHAAEQDAVGLTEMPVRRGTPEFDALVRNENPDIVFKDEEQTGADRMMTRGLKEKLDVLAEKVKAEWSDVRLRVTDAWDENVEHPSRRSNHYGGRAADITTSDRDRGKLGRLAQLAADSGIGWTFYENDKHVHVSVEETAEPDPERYAVHESAPTPKGQTRAHDAQGSRGR